jgi:hypothetical protein
MKKGRIRSGSPFEVDWIVETEARRAQPGGPLSLRNAGGETRRSHKRDTLVSVMRDARTENRPWPVREGYRPLESPD